MADILMVDDDLESRLTVRSVIKESQYQYLSFREEQSVKDALLHLKHHQPVLVIIDLSLPDGNGLELGKAALELYPQLPVMVITQLQMFETVQECINAGFAAYYLKPVTKFELLTTFNRLLKFRLSRETHQFMNNTSAQSVQTDLANPIKTAIHYIQAHYSEPITLNELADKVYLSPSHFSRLFKEETGTTFVEYLTSYRIEKSKSLLKMTSLPIEVIANNIGFTSASYFATTFKRIEGMKPSEYRKLFSNLTKIE
ncbi:YesN/AraC family two-component response regulator [Caldalkalibacillus uzonensis]|uniref:YesN/AraC family two-component response regulator n=1 Tax=Caldalkalibacillus uzonensis TaxID=353224 RepID=A0ABU0CXY5_9BACI|nr:helix-turn-helix domain-containing protein [Caldalkalibacillus uzonensis]MDQ0341005.1 YesN/AraC family two-component response regulator [Caldalkalibacillus uzonensis]